MSGKIIETNGDTLKGLIDYRNWEYNPDFIVFFKDNPDGEKIRYTPETIVGFVVADEFYKSGVVETEISPGKSANCRLNRPCKLGWILYSFRHWCKVK